MASNRIHPDDGARRRGFTLVECLIGLAISAALLAAVAVAFNASLTNYRANERMYLTTNNARQALSRMTSQLRTGYMIDPGAPGNQCNFFTATNQNITYEFRAADKKLYLRTNANSMEYVLCNNVVDANFVKTPTSDAMDCISVQISLTVEEGGTKQTLTSAAAIRRNLGST